MRRLVVVVSLMAVVAFAALGDGVASAKPAEAAAVIHIVVLHSKKGGTSAFARVFIHGHPFAFLIDTGASVTLVNPKLAQRLHLRTVGRPRTFCGVTSCSTARRVWLRHWSIGGQPLPPIVASSAPIAGTGGFAFGLLGSDVLSRFGTVTIDYRDGLMALG